MGFVRRHLASLSAAGGALVLAARCRGLQPDHVGRLAADQHDPEHGVPDHPRDAPEADPTHHPQHAAGVHAGRAVHPAAEPRPGGAHDLHGAEGRRALLDRPEVRRAPRRPLLAQRHEPEEPGDAGRAEAEDPADPAAHHRRTTRASTSTSSCSGDSPLGISNKFGIPLQTIIDLNGLDPAKPAVYVGQQIKLARLSRPGRVASRACRSRRTSSRPPTCGSTTCSRAPGRPSSSCTASRRRRTSGATSSPPWPTPASPRSHPTTAASAEPTSPGRGSAARCWPTT